MAEGTERSTWEVCLSVKWAQTALASADCEAAATAFSSSIWLVGWEQESGGQAGGAADDSARVWAQHRGKRRPAGLSDGEKIKRLVY